MAQGCIRFSSVPENLRWISSTLDADEKRGEELSSACARKDAKAVCNRRRTKGKKNNNRLANMTEKKHHRVITGKR